jgi:hypothetical protein
MVTSQGKQLEKVNSIEDSHSHDLPGPKHYEYSNEAHPTAQPKMGSPSSETLSAATHYKYLPQTLAPSPLLTPLAPPLALAPPPPLLPQQLPRRRRRRQTPSRRHGAYAQPRVSLLPPSSARSHRPSSALS